MTFQIAIENYRIVAYKHISIQQCNDYAAIYITTCRFLCAQSLEIH